MENLNKQLEDFLYTDMYRGDKFLQEIRAYLFLNSFEEVGSTSMQDYQDLIISKYHIKEELFDQACKFLDDNKNILPLKCR